MKMRKPSGRYVWILKPENSDRGVENENRNRHFTFTHTVFNIFHCYGEGNRILGYGSYYFRRGSGKRNDYNGDSFINWQVTKKED